MSLSQEYGTGEPSNFKAKGHKAAQQSDAGNKGVGEPNMKNNTGGSHGNKIGRDSSNKDHDRMLHKLMPERY